MGFSKGIADNNLYLKKIKNDLLIVEVFVDDIIFGGDDETSEAFFVEIKK